MMREAYSHEVSSCGFWPGDTRFPEPAFYAYQVPAPKGFAKQTVKPEKAFWDESLASSFCGMTMFAPQKNPGRPSSIFAKAPMKSALIWANGTALRSSVQRRPSKPKPEISARFCDYLTLIPSKK